MYSRIWRMNGLTMSRVDLPSSFTEPFAADMSALVSGAATLQSAGDKLSSTLSKAIEDLENLKLVFKAQTAEFDAYRQGMEPKLKELERGYNNARETNRRNAVHHFKDQETINELEETIAALDKKISDQQQTIRVSTGTSRQVGYEC